MYVELKQSDWLKLVIRLLTSNESALFQRSIVMLLKNLFMTSTPGLVVIGLDSQLRSLRFESRRFVPLSPVAQMQITLWRVQWYLFFNWANPGLFCSLFSVFSKQTLQFLQHYMWIMPIQYLVPGFEPTTSWMWVSPLPKPQDQGSRPQWYLLKYCSSISAGIRTQGASN